MYLKKIIVVIWNPVVHLFLYLFQSIVKIIVQKQIFNCNTEHSLQISGATGVTNCDRFSVVYFPDLGVAQLVSLV